ncbi:putative glycosyltransferase [bacterium HR11]|nr:putative glycosyltransferase [bacterium HR11]
MDWRDISVVMITLDEAERLPKMLNALPPDVGEIVVVDGGSTDGTPDVARQRGARVWVRPFTSFVEQKNWALARATRPWVLHLDADEVPSQDLLDEIAALDPPPDVHGYWVARRNFFWGKWVRHGGWWPDYKLRLFRRTSGRFVARGRRVHERVEVEGRTAYLRGYLIHETYRDLDDVQRKLRLYTTLSARDLYELGVRSRWWHRWVLPAWAFAYTWLLRGAWRDGRPGLWVAFLQAQTAWWKYWKLWELQRAGGWG